MTEHFKITTPAVSVGHDDVSAEFVLTPHGFSSIAVDSLATTTHGKAYIASAASRDSLPLALRGATLGGEDLATVFVADNDDDLEAFASSGQGQVEEIQLPSDPAARAKLLADWIAKAALKNKNGLLPLLLLPLAACGGGGGGGGSPTPVPPTPALTFTVDDVGGVVSFGGTAIGDIVATVSGATTTFTRGGLTHPSAISLQRR